MENNKKLKNAIKKLHCKLLKNDVDPVWSGKKEELNYFYYHRNRYLSLLNNIKISQKAKILDIGPSHFTLLLKDIYPQSKVTTLDIDKCWNKRLLEKIDLVVFDLNDIKNRKLPFNNSFFDVIIFNEVIEHINTEDQKLFKELKRILKKDGVIYIGTPNYASLTNRIKLLLGINPLDLVIENNRGRAHVREYTLSEVCKLLTLNNFIIKQKKYYLYFDLPNQQDDLIVKIKKILFLPLAFFIPQFRRGMEVAATKSSASINQPPKKHSQCL